MLFLLLTAIKQFARMDAAAVARAIRHGGGFLGLLLAALLLLRGRIGLAAALAGMAASFAGWRTSRQPWTTFFRSAASGPGASAGRVTTARSTMIEMRLDHDTGAMSGEVLAGAYAGRALDALSRAELLALREELSRDDPAGVNLLEAYFDRRFAGWRQADEGDRDGPRRSPAGAMSRREALDELGLPEGASAAEIIRAHRTLMKKFHPDHGGETARAARVNQAKDVLMQRQG
ncbi:MAG TPA: DnaJ domain-containing protein [Roseiarcus sp.]|nr:DnaJ domain-containing protein [Roseiarcus sp.]